MSGLRQLSLVRCRERRPIHYCYPARSPPQCYWKSTGQPFPVDSVNRCDFETHPGWLARRSIALSVQHLSKPVGLRICDTASRGQDYRCGTCLSNIVHGQRVSLLESSLESAIWNLELHRRSFQPEVVRKTANNHYLACSTVSAKSIEKEIFPAIL